QKLATMAAAAALHLRSLPGAIDRAAPPEEAPAPFIAADPETHKLLRLVREFAALDGTTPRRRLQHLMIVGERGVGKELIAQALHHWSGRHDRPFRAVNMSRINAELAPAEIFGARKGGYTGATADRRGLIQQFAGGTLFLDEIDEAGDKVQAMLKRVVEYGTYERVGDPAELRADVRFIVATNRVAGDTPLIKEDLRDRFWEIRVPPLRERRGDVRPLAVHFARRHEYVLPEPVLAWLESPALDWPGNVRQLQTIVERACSLAHAAGELTLDLFHQCVADGSQRYPTPPAAEDAALREGETLEARLQKIEKALIEHALDETRGNKTRTAEKLGGTRQWLYKRCQALGIKR
ncbi:MAG TPA: sigma 54-interacting transcriptional regulator, partial [Pyrinomonadaceae bacterium]|nr:sigma 54-interacting transcriptional regulator [Pyrinomonadaceae bacterium]